MNNLLIYQPIANGFVGYNEFGVVDARMGHAQLIKNPLLHKIRVGLSGYFGDDHSENKRPATITPSLTRLKFQWRIFQCCKKSTVGIMCIEEIIILIPVIAKTCGMIHQTPDCYSVPGSRQGVKLFPDGIINTQFTSLHQQ